MGNLFDFMQDEITRAANRTEMFRALTFIKVTPGTRDPANRTSGTQPTSVSYTCSGTVSNYEDIDESGELIKVGDRRILILVNSLNLPVGVLPPTSGDRVIGDDGRTYEVIATGRDPAGALYDLHARG